MSNASTKQWRVPSGLIVLTLVPAAAGAARLQQLATGRAITPENARFVAEPLPVVAHIISATVFCLFGAFQFVPKLRNAGRKWHRITGRLVAPFGLLAALSGLWMSIFYKHPAMDHPSLVPIRLVVGAAMVISLVLGISTARRRSFGSHRAWMIRSYAIGIGAGTQVLTSLPWVVLYGTSATGVARTVLLAAGWVINLAVAEWFIRWPSPAAHGVQHNDRRGQQTNHLAARSSE